MLQAWLSIGYIILLAILVLAFIVWRKGGPVLSIAALVVGIPIWFGWEYARPTWTTGVITGTEVRRTDPDARGNTTDFEYIYMRNRSDRGLELTNDDSWWWLKRNSELDVCFWQMLSTNSWARLAYSCRRGRNRVTF